MISQYLAQKLLDHLFGKTTYTAPSTLYFALMLTAPDGSAGSGSEVSTSGTGYARSAISNSTGNFSGATLAGPSVKQNASPVAFPTATAAWGTVGFFAIYDAATGGNLLFYDALTTPAVINSGGTFAFENAGDFTIQLGN